MASTEVIDLRNLDDEVEEKKDSSPSSPEQIGDEAKGTELELDYRTTLGSLEQDKALQCWKLSDDDSRWELIDEQGGLRKIVLRTSDQADSRKPERGETVCCSYSGFLQSTGEMVDSSRERQDPFKFRIGMEKVIKGWDVGIATMKIGERAILRCSSEFAYGETGTPPNIPPNAALDFVVQLESITAYEQISGIDAIISKKPVVEVDGWETPKDLWYVTVSYVGHENDESGRVWCEGKEEKIQIPFDLEFEEKGCIPEYEQPRGFYQCLRNLKENETSNFKLECNDNYTFGSTGSEKHSIAPGTNLFYQISVSGFEKFIMSIWQLKSEEEKLPKASELKDIANGFFRRKKLAVAKKVYKEIVDITTGIRSAEGEEKKTIEAITIACYSNTALVEIKLENLAEAGDQIDKGLAINPKHEKLRYRKALIYFKRGEYDEAEQLLATLAQEFPQNKGVKSLITRTNRANKSSKRNTRKLAKKMFRSKNTLADSEAKSSAQACAKSIGELKDNVCEGAGLQQAAA